MLALKALALPVVALPLFFSSPASALAIPSPYSASFLVVPQLDCGQTLGSGVRIAANLIVTAAHVPSGTTCSAFDAPLKVLRFEPGQDVAFVEGALPDGLRAIVSCEGIKEGGRYLAMGYADGGAPDVEPLIGTKDRNGQQVVMRGHVYHGMSGGAVLNEAGATVAIINAMERDGKPLAFVTPLSQTYLCKGKA